MFGVCLLCEENGMSFACLAETLLAQKWRGVDVNGDAVGYCGTELWEVGRDVLGTGFQYGEIRLVH